MKRISIFLALICVFLISCEDDSVKIIGSGKIITEARNVESFHTVSTNSIIDVTIKQSDNQSVSVTTDDNVIQQVETKVSNGTLFIGLEDGEYKDITIKIAVEIPTLNAIDNLGTGDMNIEGFSDLDTFKAKLTGTGDVKLTGSAEQLFVKSLGTGNFKGFGFIVEECEVSQTGTGNCEIHAINTIEGKLTGTGNLYYRGTPKINVTTVGTGKVKAAN